MEEINLEEEKCEEDEDKDKDKDQIHTALGSIGRWQVQNIFITGDIFTKPHNSLNSKNQMYTWSGQVR